MARLPKNLAPIALFIAIGLALPACKRSETEPTSSATTPVAEEEDLAPGQPPTPPVEPPKDAIIPVTVSANAFAVGSAQDANGAAITPKASYGLADTVYASLPSGKYPNGAVARVYWTFENGDSQKMEEKTISGTTTSFSFGRDDGMQAGKYNVEIEINEKPVGIVDFVVK